MELKDFFSSLLGDCFIAAQKSYPVYVDGSIERFQKISISAGVRGMQILLAPSDYLRANEGYRHAVDP